MKKKWIMKKKLARFFGRNFFNFKGKFKLIKFIYSSDKFGHVNSGEKFVTDYYGFKYEGITSNYIDWGVYFFEGLERGLINYFFHELNKNTFDYFLDIGAGSGTISLPFCKYNNLKIICFEPLEYSYKKLTNNYKINEQKKFHEFHNIALSNKEETGEISYSKFHDNPGTASIIENKIKNPYDISKQIVNLNTLDNIYNFKDKKIILKIDVERYEDYVIDGGLNLLKNNQILMYIETSNHNLIKKLKSLNFDIFFPKFFYDKYSFSPNLLENHVIAKNY